jgi:signal transduction histidine kinase
MSQDALREVRKASPHGLNRAIAPQEYASTMQRRRPPAGVVPCGDAPCSGAWVVSLLVEPGHPPTAPRWPRAGRWAAADWTAAILLTVILRGLFGTAIPAASTSLWLGLAVAAALCFPVALRRHSPAVILGVLLAEPLTLTIAGIPPTSWALLPAALALYLVAATRDIAAAAAALAVTLAVLALVSLAMLLHARSLHESAGNIAFSGIAAGLAALIAWAAGAAIRQRRGLDQLQRLQEARQAQDELDRAWRSVTEERLRIARELHDVVAHSMTVIAVHAGVGHHVIDSQPAEARAALSVIETTARDALTEMRRLLGVLRQPDDGPAGPHYQRAGPRSDAVPADAAPEHGADLQPAPGLADLNQLLAHTASAGVHVRVHITGQRQDLAAGIDLTAYRIIQEALTNVVRHSGSSHCQLTLGYREDEILIEVTDRGRDRQAVINLRQDSEPGGADAQPEAPGPGHGIVGMRERVSLYGGQFSATALSGAGFRVTAVIPLHGDDT